MVYLKSCKDYLNMAPFELLLIKTWTFWYIERLRICRSYIFSKWSGFGAPYSRRLCSFLNICCYENFQHRITKCAIRQAWELGILQFDFLESTAVEFFNFRTCDKLYRFVKQRSDIKNTLLSYFHMFIHFFLQFFLNICATSDSSLSVDQSCLMR